MEMVEAGSLREPIEGRLRARPVPDGTGALRVGRHEFPLPGGGRVLVSVPETDSGMADGLVVMLHGAGGDAEQSLDLVGDEAARRGVALVAPDAHGSTWDLLVDRLGTDVQAIDEALAQILPRGPVADDRIGIAGFSDGASYALSLGLANGDLFSWVLAFSPGFLAPPMLVGRPAVFVSHGRDDRVLPIARTSRRIVPGLEDGGYTVVYREFAGGHEVPATVSGAAFDCFLDRATAVPNASAIP